MLSKINVIGIVKGHLRTLGRVNGADVTKLDRSYIDLALFYALPPLIAVLLVACPGSLRLKSTDGLLNVAGILFGFLAAIYFFVLERIGVGTRGESHERVLRETRYNVGYATLVLLLLLVLLALPAFGTGMVPIDPTTGRAEHVAGWLSGLIVGLGVHFVLTMLMIVKRVDGVAS